MLDMQVAALVVSPCLEKTKNTIYPGPEACCGMLWFRVLNLLRHFQLRRGNHTY